MKFRACPKPFTFDKTQPADSIMLRDLHMDPREKYRKKPSWFNCRDDPQIRRSWWSWSPLGVSENLVYHGIPIKGNLYWYNDDKHWLTTGFGVFTDKPIDFGQVFPLTTSRAASSSSFLFPSRSAAACRDRKIPRYHRLDRGIFPGTQQRSGATFEKEPHF